MSLCDVQLTSELAQTRTSNGARAGVGAVESATFSLGNALKGDFSLKIKGHELSLLFLLLMGLVFSQKTQKFDCLTYLIQWWPYAKV